MSADVETKLRGPDAYSLAKRALAEMERLRIWPTPLNFELWTHVVAAPESDLAREIARLLDEGATFTDTVSDELAAAFLPRARLNEQIRDAGDALSKELTEVSQAIQTARKSSEVYGEALADASKSLTDEQDPATLKSTIVSLSEATRHVSRENRILETRLAASTNEVNRLREHLEQVRRDATTDGLTNLANRKAFDDELERICEEADELCLAVLDIDNFKNFNDTWGHQTGDQVLRFVASVIGRHGSPPRLVARYGGEEFALLFPQESADAAFQVLEEIRNEVCSRALKRRSTNEDLGAVSISCGLAQRRAHERPHELMERADAALYRSKRCGRNRTTNAEDVATAA